VEADTKDMVQRLQRRPADLALFEEVKTRLRAERRYKSFVKVLRWWAKRAPTPPQGAQAMFEAGEVAQRKIKDIDQAKELFEAALEIDPTHEAATAALAGLSSDEEFDDLLDGLDSESIRPPSMRPSDQPPSEPPAGAALPAVGPPARRPSVRPPAAAPAGSFSPPTSQQPLPAPPPSLGAVPPPAAPEPAPAAAGDLFSTSQDDLFKVDPPPAAPEPAAPAPPAPTAPAARQVLTGQEDDPTGRFASDRPPALAVEAASEPGPPDERTPVALPADGTEPALYDDDEDDEDDLKAAHFPVASILGDGGEPAASKGGKARLEVVRRRGDTVVGARNIRFMGSAGGDAIRARRAGMASYSIKLADGASGWVVRASAGPGAGREGLPEGPLKLEVGDQAEVTHEGVISQLRVARLTPPPMGAARTVPYKRYVTVFISAFGMHALGLALIASLASVGVNFRVETRSRDEIFAEARLKPEEQRPKPKLKKPKPVKLRKRKAPKPPPEEAKAKIPKSLRNKLRKIARKRDTNTSAVDRLVNSLKSPVEGEGKTLKDVVSNIDAVKGGEASGAFRIGGTLAALDGKGPNIVSGGGGDIGTLGGKEATGNLARLKGKKSGGVRGKVTSVKALAKVQGSLSRGEVLKVLNKHQHKIQRCYERALLAKPSLAGRLTYTWSIKTSGRVGSVQNTGNTLGDTKVSKCIAGVIKKMKFPRPKGGSVSVTFPWIFKRAM